MNDFTLHPQFADDGHDDLEALIHETASKFLELENTAVEALCLAYLVRIGDDPITDWMVVRQRSEDGLTLKVWLQRKEDAPSTPPPPAGSERYPSGDTNCPVCGHRAHWFVDDFGTSLFCVDCDMREHMEWLDRTAKINADYDAVVNEDSEKRRQALRLMNQERSLRNHSVDFHWGEFKPFTPPPSQYKYVPKYDPSLVSM